MVIVNSITLTVLIALISTTNASRLINVLMPNSYLEDVDRRHKHLLKNDAAQPTPSTVNHHFYMDRRSIQKCIRESDEETFMSMDRLCETCHEMFRHRDPNLRANCRNNCFDNDDFVFCFNHFVGGVQVART